jgi:hypothetical protein
LKKFIENGDWKQSHYNYTKIIANKRQRDNKGYGMYSPLSNNFTPFTKSSDFGSSEEFSQMMGKAELSVDGESALG